MVTLTLALNLTLTLTLTWLGVTLLLHVRGHRIVEQEAYALGQRRRRRAAAAPSSRTTGRWTAAALHLFR